MSTVARILWRGRRVAATAADIQAVHVRVRTTGAGGSATGNTRVALAAPTDRGWLGEEVPSYLIGGLQGQVAVLMEHCSTK